MNIRTAGMCLGLVVVSVGCRTVHADPGASLARGLVAHWTFDEGKGAVARDVTGNGHDATLKNTDWVPSPRGHALHFDSKEDLAEYANIDTMMLSGDVTLAVWVRTDGSVAPNTHRLIFGDAGYAVMRNGNLAVDGYQRLSFEWGNGESSVALLAPGTLMNGAWRHVVVVADSRASHATMYLDGAVVVEMPMPFPISKTSAKRRLTGWFYNGFLQGDLDDIRLYSRALSPPEVQQLFRSQGEITVDAGTVVYDGAGGVPQGRATVRFRNVSQEPRRLEVSGPGVPRQEIHLKPGTGKEVALGTVPLTPVWSRRNDLFICGESKPTGKLTITTMGADHADTQHVPLTSQTMVEPIHVVVQDPWQREMPSGKTKRVTMDVKLSLPAEQLSRGMLRIRLVSRETGEEALRREVRAPAAAMPLVLNVRKLPWGAYDLQTSFLDHESREVTSTRRVATILPGGKQRIRVLNNLVSELVDARAPGMLAQPRVEFMNPRHGWVWFQAAGTCALALGEDALLRSQGGQPAAEAMRLLPAGRHVVAVAGTPTDLVVRAIPALVYNVYPSTPRITPFGANSWERLQKHMLPNINMIESGLAGTPEHREWLAQGRSWIANIQAPGLIDKKEWTADKMLALWRAPRGWDLAGVSGIQVDEYYSGAKSLRFEAPLVTSLARLSEDPDFAGKLWIPFLAGKYGATPDNLFVKTVLGAGWPFSEEVYLGEMPTEEENLSNIRARFHGVAAAYESIHPGSLRRMIFTPMFAYLPYCTANRCPQADFRVHLDQQMQMLATDPAFFGLWGVQPYRSNYVDEEILNCMGRLLRHFCIEGKSERLLRDPYELKHVADPDFEEGLARWQVAAAAAGSVRPGTFGGYGTLAGRYPSGRIGDTFAVMTRSAKAPNVLSQELRQLQPGRLYSVKVITGDLADLQGGKTRKVSQTLSIQIDGATVVPGGFHHPFPSCRGPRPFTAKKPFWMTYHWLQFRATGGPAALSISDWAKPGEPGGPVGQQVMVNFVEVQPVLETQ
jgi:hypothetical protein